MQGTELLLFTGAASALLLTGCHENAAPKPNIILIMTDQQRGDCIGAMGNPYIHTPHLDSLAGDGLLFTNAYTSVPSSTPARSVLLTGMAPWHNGMVGYGTVARSYKYEMPRMLDEAGYKTFAIGKLHYAPQRNLHGYSGALLDESGRVHTPDFESDYRKWFREEAPGMNPDTTGIGWNDHTGKVYLLQERLHPTAWTGDQAVDYIKNYDESRPLFLKVSFARPHSPYDPPQRFYDMYKDGEVPAPYKSDWSRAFADRPNVPDASFGDFGVEHALDSRRYYYGAVTFIDEKIGEIIQALKDKGMYDNSLIVFISDHGDMLGDHNHWRKTYPYEGSSHIPFIMKLPHGFRSVYGAGSKMGQVVELRDVLPTFLEAAGVKVPEDMDGRSLLTLCANKDARWRDYIDMEHAEYKDYKNWVALTDGCMKYIWFSSTGEEQLFNISEDKSESLNLADDENYRSALELWRQRMVNHLSERGEPYVKDGKLGLVKDRIIYSPNYPGPVEELEK